MRPIVLGWRLVDVNYQPIRYWTAWLISVRRCMYLGHAYVACTPASDTDLDRWCLDQVMFDTSRRFDMCQLPNTVHQVHTSVLLWRIIIGDLISILLHSDRGVVLSLRGWSYYSTRVVLLIYAGGLVALTTPNPDHSDRNIDLHMSTVTRPWSETIWNCPIMREVLVFTAVSSSSSSPSSWSSSVLSFQARVHQHPLQLTHQ